MKKARLIRVKYPNPSPFPKTPLYGPLKGEYCVAGAFTLARHSFKPVETSTFHQRFPSVRPLAIELQAENAQLSDEDALEFASRIVDHNDRKEFNAAWRALDEALEFGHKKPGTEKTWMHNN